MSSEIENLLQGTRADVSCAAKEINGIFNQIRERGTDGVAQALRFECQVLRKICLALNANNLKSADIFCDIVESMLPYLKPCTEKAVLWETHLFSLRFIHIALCQEATIKECQRIYKLITAQRCRIQTATDYKIYYEIHIHHFNFHHQLLRGSSTAELVRNEIHYALEGLGVLFEEMRQQKTANNFTYANLLSELNQKLLGKRSATFLKFFSTLQPDRTAKMFMSLFKLLSINTLPSPTEMTSQIVEYCNAFLALFRIDLFTPQLGHQFGLQLLRCCRDHFKAISAQHYSIQLLYYYVKLLYTQESTTADFKTTYIDICKKYINFFEHKGKFCTQEQWFMDIIVIMLQIQELCRSSKSLPVFWQQFEGDSIYIAHLALLDKFMDVGEPMTSSTLGTVCKNEQCKSMGKHCSISFGLAAINVYSIYEEARKPQSASQVSNLQRNLLLSVQKTIGLIDSIECRSQESANLSRVLHSLTNIANQVSSRFQMHFFVQLMKAVQKIRSRFPYQDYIYMLQRVYKMSEHCESAELSAQLQSSYIAVIQKPVRMHHQMAIYYCKTRLLTKCITQLHEESPLCAELTSGQRNNLYASDMMAALVQHKTNVPLIQSLIRCRRNNYDFVLLSRHMHSHKDVMQQLDTIYTDLRISSSSLSMTRLQNLVAAHAAAGVFQNALETLKTKIPVKEVLDVNLEDIFVKYNRMDINVGNEKRVVDIATFAINAFTEFYNRADDEPISSDEAFIDWEALIDDVTTMALALVTMGYMRQADDAWLLLLRVTRNLGACFNYLRAISHFLARYKDQSEFISRFDFKEEIQYTGELLDTLWPSLTNSCYFKRHQTVVLLCLCQLANYHISSGRPHFGQLLLMLVDRQRNEFDERRGKSDIVLVTLQALRFRLLYQQNDCKPLPAIPTALGVMDKLLESVRNIQYISSMDSATMMLLMCDLVRECTECSLNRFTERITLINSLFNITLQNGFALRSVEILFHWLWTNLQTENVEFAQSKVRLIDHLLGVSKLQVTTQKPKSNIISSLDTAETSHMNNLLLNIHMQQGPGAVEPIRKQNLPISSSLLENLKPPAPLKMKYRLYVKESEIPKVLQGNEQLETIYFFMGCLHARLNFLSKDYDQLGAFYERGNIWLEKHNNKSNINNSITGLGHMQLVHHIYHANYLRAKGDFQGAIVQLEKALSDETKSRSHLSFDINYRYNILVQLRTARIELHRKQNPISKGINLRRALQFNISPEGERPILTPSLEFAAPVKMVKAKKPIVTNRPPKFEIYTERNNSSLDNINTTNSSSTEQLTSPSELDLNTCQMIEIIDSSDDDVDESGAKPKSRQTQLHGTKSVPTVLAVQPRSTKTRTLRKSPSVIEQIKLDDSEEQKKPVGRLQRHKSTEVRKVTTSRVRKNPIVEKSPPPTTSQTVGRRLRRQKAAVETDTITTSTATTRSRQRN